MAIRNYVGARYVPKFADPVGWQANTSYEAMVIVTYNNSSYTSKIPVPASVGNPAENSKYWVLTGNYNAQIEEYRQAVADAQEHARDGICAIDEGNNTTATKSHKAHEYFWWKSKLYRAKENINAGALLSDGRNIEEGNVANGVYGNTIEFDSLNEEIRKNYESIVTLQSNVSTNTNDINGLKTNLTGHINNKANPHGVTKAQVGLGNVDNVSKANILQSVYPVGSIYISATSTSPAELFAGTWERIKDRFLLAVGDTYTAGSTGGEAEHQLTVDEMPNHSHSTNIRVADQNPTGIVSGSNGWLVDAKSAVKYTDSVGGGKPHNNMPPYIAVYTWKRVA